MRCVLSVVDRHIQPTRARKPKTSFFFGYSSPVVVDDHGKMEGFRGFISHFERRSAGYAGKEKRRAER